ncbi:MAG TPA: thioredoxin [Thermomicrobiales bacterium]|nr:thioredoxin [Thermomicrobiales bacterium]
MGKPQEVTDATFEQQVLKADGPVLVDFWAPWCGPCRMVAPVLEEIAQDQAGKLTILKLNVDENQHTAGRYGVMSIPTMIIYKDGQPVKQVVGAKPKAALMRDIEPYLNKA